MFIENLSLHDDVALICLAIKLLLVSLQKWEKGEENKTEEREPVKDNVTRQLLAKLTSKLQRLFHYQIQEYYQREPLLRELKVLNYLGQIYCTGL